MFPPGYNGPPGHRPPPPGMMPPPGMAPPPGMGAPPGIPSAPFGAGLPAAAPGVAPPPGMPFNVPPAMAPPRNLPANFQPPANINFSAPIIRMGTSSSQRGPGGDNATRRDTAAPPARRGLGMDGPDGARRDENKTAPRLPTREEIARTIFVGNIPKDMRDSEIEDILGTAGSLSRFYRATDANDKPQTFGFAEFGDAQSLRTATEIFKDVHVPSQRPKPSQTNVKKEGDEDHEMSEEVETTKLQIMVDDASVKYAEEWTKNEDESKLSFRFDSAKADLDSVLARLKNPLTNSNEYPGNDDAPVSAVPDDENVVHVNIDITAGEDELSDIPAEMREIVAAEIAAFRDRSNKRDMERLRKEEEIEAEQRRRDGRRASPPASAPTGPGGANGVPLGPRADRGVQGAPSGPKNSQFPRDYQAGVNFVNGGSVNNGVYTSREDDDESASDSEIEKRRKEKKFREHEDAYRQELSLWLKHESRTVSSLQRNNDHLKKKEQQKSVAREAAAHQLEKFDDDKEAELKRQLYYRDHGEYMRERLRYREREEREDRIDREHEQRENAARQREKQHARDEADAFLDETAEEMLRSYASREPQQQFKISLGAATKKLTQTSSHARTAADVENLLEDEEPEEEAATKKRELIPISHDANGRDELAEEDRDDAQRKLARDIPSDKEGLWKWPISWDHLSDKYIDNDIKNWAAKKVLDSLGVQEDLLVDAVVDHLRNRGSPDDLVEDLKTALDDEAEGLVKKLWRMIIYYSETEKRGIK